MQAVEWTGHSLRYLDQTELPFRESFSDATDPQDVYDAIRRLAIRGAPLIGIAAAYAAALAARALRPETPRTQAEGVLRTFLEHFASARPTAVNLRWALERAQTRLRSQQWTTAGEIAVLFEQEAMAIHEEDRRSCETIGRLGADLIPPDAAVLTHCNTGFLATGGDGTALNVIRHAFARGLVRRVYVDETRPLLQGSRLTAWELRNLGIPSTLITDSTAAFLMSRAMVQAVVVGADRIAANGDVANKIGTYSLAVAARRHGIPMLVAAPFSTFDVSLRSGEEIPIEERHGREVTRIGSVSIAPEDTPVYAPAFDVTPAELISALITDRGVLRPPYAGAIRSLGQQGGP